MKHSVFFYEEGNFDAFRTHRYEESPPVPPVGAQVIIEKTPYRVVDVCFWFERRSVDIGIFLRLDVADQELDDEDGEDEEEDFEEFDDDEDFEDEDLDDGSEDDEFEDDEFEEGDFEDEEDDEDLEDEEDDEDRPTEGEGRIVNLLKKSAEKKEEEPEDGKRSPNRGNRDVAKASTDKGEK